MHNPVVLVVLYHSQEDVIPFLDQILSQRFSASGDDTHAGATFASADTIAPDAEADSQRDQFWPDIEDLIADPSLSIWSRWR